jgi:regulatory protein
LRGFWPKLESVLLTLTPMIKQIPLTYSQAIERLQRYCDKSEKCQWDVVKKAREWNFKEFEIQEMVVALIATNHLNELRYASAFVHDRFTFNRWGARKIEQALKAKGISSRNIKDALLTLPQEDQQLALMALIKKKEPQLKGLQLYQKKIKLMRFLLSKGFEAESCERCIHQWLANPS